MYLKTQCTFVNFSFSLCQLDALREVVYYFVFCFLDLSQIVMLAEKTCIGGVDAKVTF